MSAACSPEPPASAALIKSAGRGISTGDFQEALAALLGKDAPNLSPAVIARLTAALAEPRAEAEASTGL